MAQQNNREVSFGNGGVNIGLGGPISLNVGAQGLQGLNVGSAFISGNEEEGLNIEKGNVTVNIGGPNKSGLLVPIGNTGLYHSPDGPIDPWDCERWPDSIYCGGGFNPITKPLSIDVEVSVNRCEVCVTFKPTIVGLSGPPYTICKRSNAPGCNYEPEPEPEPGPNIPDPLIPPDPPPISGAEPRLWVFAMDGAFQKIYYEGNVLDAHTLSSTAEVFPHPTIKHIDVIKVISRYKDVYAVPGFSGFVEATEIKYWGCDRINQTFINTSFFYNDYPPSIEERSSGYVSLYFARSYGGSAFNVYGSGDDALMFLRNKRSVWSNEMGSGWICPKLIYSSLPLKEQKITVPPPLPLNNPMDCCSENNELLRLLYSKIGGDRLPATLPEYLLADRTKNIQVENVVDFLAWLTKNIDAISGQWPIEIEIEDTNPLQKGDQSKKMPLPNMAESLAELYGMSFKSAINTDILIQFCMRLAAETMAAKNAALIAQDYVKANAEFLGYRGNPKRREIDYAFDPDNLGSLEEILNESKQSIVGWENQQKDTVLEFLQRLMYVASLWKARHLKSPKDISKIAQSVQNMAQQAGDSEEVWKFFIEALNNPNSYFYGADKDPNAAPEVKEV